MSFGSLWLYNIWHTIFSNIFANLNASSVIHGKWDFCFSFSLCFSLSKENIWEGAYVSSVLHGVMSILGNVKKKQ